MGVKHLLVENPKPTAFAEDKGTAWICRIGNEKQVFVSRLDDRHSADRQNASVTIRPSHKAHRDTLAWRCPAQYLLYAIGYEGVGYITLAGGTSRIAIEDILSVTYKYEIRALDQLAQIC